MSNLIEQLQEGLSNNKELYEQIKNEEILNLIKNYRKNSLKYRNYELYFNNKCLEDYKIFLVSNLNNGIEKILMNEHSKEILEMKIVLLFHKYKDNLKKILKQFKVNKDDLINKIRETSNLKKEIDMRKEMKKSYKIQEERYNNIKDNFDNIIEEEIKKYLDTKIKSELLEDYMNYLIRINKRLENMRINYKEYNEFLMKIFTENDYDNIEDMLKDNVTKDYIDDNQLSLMILKYNNVKEQTLEELINYLPEDINVDFIKKYKELDLENIEDLDEINKIIKNHILIEIIEVCEQPLNEEYLLYLEEIYRINNLEEVYDKIVKQNKDIKDMLIEYEDDNLIFTKEIIERIKKDKDYKVELLKRSFREDIKEEELNKMIEEFKMIEDILKKDEKYEILDFYIINNLSKILHELRDFNLSTDIKELKKNLKMSNNDDSLIKAELYKYGIEKKKNKDYIYVSVNDIFKNNNIIKFFDFYYNLERKLKILNNKEIIENLNKIIQTTLSQVFEHYIKSIDMIEESNDERLYYNLNNDKNIRVYINDPIEQLLQYILKNNNEDKNKKEYIYKNILEHIFKYEYYNVKLDTPETISEKLNVNIRIQNYNNIIQILNDIFENKYYKEEIKELRNRLEENLLKMIEMKNDNKSMKLYKRLIELNNRYNILSNMEMNYLRLRWEEYKIFYVEPKIKRGKKNKEKLEKLEEENINTLKFFKLILKEVKVELEKNSINIFNDKKSNKKMKKENELIKELRKLMNNEIKSFKDISSKPDKVYIVNNADIERDIKDNDITYLTIDTFQKMYKKTSGEKTKDKIIMESINTTLRILEREFGEKYEEKEKLVKDIISDKNKIIIITKKNCKGIDYKNVYDRLNKENKSLYDIVKFITILYYVDSTIHKGKDILNIINSKNKNKIVKEESLRNKKIFILKNKKISKINEYSEDDYDEIIKEENGKYYTKRDKLNREDFILLDSLKDQVVKVTRGIYKGMYGRLLKTKDMKFLTDEVKKNMKIEKKYYNELIMKIDKKIVKINLTSIKDIVDEVELSRLEEYRKKLKNNQLDDKYLLNIKLNPRINKVLSSNEERFLKEYRNERINELKYQKSLYENKIVEKKENVPKFVVKINEGQKNQRNILLNTNEVKINTKEILNNEIIELIKSKRDNKVIEFTNLYDMMKYIFNHLNIIDNKELEYFSKIYKESIKIYNFNKMNNMKKIDIRNKIRDDIRKLEKNIKILKKREGKKKLENKEKEYLNKIMKLLKVKNIQNNKFDEEIKRDNLELYYDKEISKYNNDIMKEKKIYYYKENDILLREDINEIKKIRIKKVEEEEKLEEELKGRINEIINKFKDILGELLMEKENKEVKLINYFRDEIIELDEDEEEEIDIDDILGELENIEKEEKGEKRKLTWLEIMDLPSEEFSDFEQSEEL